MRSRRRRTGGLACVRSSDLLLRWLTVRPYGAPPELSSASRAVFASTDRLIFWRPWIGQPADDTTPRADYRHVVRLRRPDPLQLDIAFALLLFVAAECEIWLTNDAGRYAHVAALTAPVLAASVAVRRFHPLSARV